MPETDEERRERRRKYYPGYVVIITEADGTQNVVGPFDDELAATLAANGIETGTRFTQVTPMLVPRKPWDY